MKRTLTLIMTLALTLTTWSLQAAINPHIVDLDVSIDGVADDKEFLEPAPETTPNGPGGFVCSNGWKKITLKADGVNDPMKARLNWDSSKIEVWTATNGGTEITSPKLWDPASDMPTELWVKGVEVSATGPTKDASGNWLTCGPEHITLEAINNGADPTTPGTYYDRVAFTVYHVESITVTPKDTPDDYELPDPVKIAAGAIASDAHQADVVIQVLPGVPGIPIDISLLDGRGHESGKDAKLVMGSVTAQGGGGVVAVVTSTDGKIEGVLTSSDVIDSCTIHTCTKESKVLFTWDEFDDEEEYTDTNGDKEYTDEEPYTDADGNGEWTGPDWTSETPYLVTPGTSIETLRLRHNRGTTHDENWKPLNAHNIRFYVEQVRYVDTNGLVVTLLNTPDFPSDLSEWASFPEDTIPTDDNGVVSVTLTMEDKTNMIYLGMVAYDFSVYDEPAEMVSASLMAPIALTSGGATRAEAETDPRDDHKIANRDANGNAITVELHPKPKDFKNYPGRVMINTPPSAPAYWTSAQTEDRKVKITARLKPGVAAEGKTVYFRVVDPDPDDLSPYEEDEEDEDTGDNKTEIDKAGKLSTDTAVAVVPLGAAYATAEVELTITDQYSGDNYIVECSLDPNFTTVADSTCTLVAWKRVGWRHHKMWKKSSDLVETFVPDLTDPPSTEPSLVRVVDASIFSINDWVIVFDANRPNGERVQVLEKLDGNVLKVQTLRHSYTHGHRLIPPGNEFGKLAAVALESAGFYNYPYVDEELHQAYGSDPAGRDGGCFVEFKEIGGGVKVPFRPYYGQIPDPSMTYFDFFPERPGEMNVLSANRMEMEGVPDAYGWSVTAKHFVVLYEEILTKHYPDIAEQRNPSAKIAAHEFMHVLSGHDDCTHEVAWDNIPGKACLLKSPPVSEWLENGHVKSHIDHIDAVRANVVFYTPAP